MHISWQLQSVVVNKSSFPHHHHHHFRWPSTYFPFSVLSVTQNSFLPAQITRKDQQSARYLSTCSRHHIYRHPRNLRGPVGFLILGSRNKEARQRAGCPVSKEICYWKWHCSVWDCINIRFYSGKCSLLRYHNFLASLYMLQYLCKWKNVQDIIRAQSLLEKIFGLCQAAVP